MLLRFVGYSILLLVLVKLALIYRPLVLIPLVIMTIWDLAKKK